MPPKSLEVQLSEYSPSMAAVSVGDDAERHRTPSPPSAATTRSAGSSSLAALRPSGSRPLLRAARPASASEDHLPPSRGRSHESSSSCRSDHPQVDDLLQEAQAPIPASRQPLHRNWSLNSLLSTLNLSSHLHPQQQQHQQHRDRRRERVVSSDSLTGAEPGGGEGGGGGDARHDPFSLWAGRRSTEGGFDDNYDPTKCLALWSKISLEMEDVLFEEEDFISRNRFLRRSSPSVDLLSGRVPFSLALSGGGVRAAAFQAGVLWRLAEEGCIEQVEHLVAVSGGAYLASSFCSHIVEASSPSSTETLQAWYKQIVARTLIRMQNNASYFIRDWGSNQNGAGRRFWPPFLDALMFVFIIAYTIIITPLTYLIVFLNPICEYLRVFMGLSMQAAYCTNDARSTWDIFEVAGPFHKCMEALVGMTICLFLVWLPGKCMLSVACRRCCRLRCICCRLRCCRRTFGKDCPVLFIRSLGAALTRTVALFGFLLVLLICIMVYKLADPKQVRAQNCQHYVKFMEKNEEFQACSDYKLTEGVWGPWWKDPTLYNESAISYGVGPSIVDDDHDDVATLVLEHDESSSSDGGNGGNGGGPLETDASSGMLDLSPQRKNPEDEPKGPYSAFDFVGGCFFGASILFLLALFLEPVFPGSVYLCLLWMLPLIATLLFANLLLHRIFGRLSGDPTFWPQIRADYMAGFACLLLICYHPLHNWSHRYYSSSLRKSYFSNGADVQWEQLKRNAFCPFLLLTGSVTDWRGLQPGRKGEGITEISMSCLHTGSSETQFARTPSTRSLATCTALAAAATDAFVLGMTKGLSYRFLLEFFNLRMGDFISFETVAHPVSWRLQRWVGRLSCLSWFQSEFLYMYTVPLIFAFIAVILALLAGESTDLSEQGCRQNRYLYQCSFAIVSALFLLSYFGAIPLLECFEHALMRQLQMAMRYRRISKHPPSMIYVSDGGVQDCTGILQLMRRRAPRILLVLAAADPEDELKVLIHTMKLAGDHKLGSFYDPVDPRRSLGSLLLDFKNDRSKCFLQIGIRYGWDEPDISRVEEARQGHLFIVKNRLPEGWGDPLVKPPLTFDEIAFGSSMDMAGEGLGQNLHQSDLTGCCCNCCHGKCHCNNIPCCGQFPHISNGNQFITPAQFANLARLGYHLSRDAAEEMKRPLDHNFSGRWQHDLGTEEDVPTP